MYSIKRSSRSRQEFALLACLAGILGFCVSGCSLGGDAAGSPDVRAKAKEYFKKRFQNFGETKKERKTSRR
jgi:hypothetical protein